jgi:hypothetical protein
VASRLPGEVLFVDAATGLVVTRYPGPAPESVPSGALGDLVELRVSNPVRVPAALMLTAEEFEALRRWLTGSTDEEKS